MVTKPSGSRRRRRSPLPEFIRIAREDAEQAGRVLQLAHANVCSSPAGARTGARVNRKPRDETDGYINGL